MPRLRHLRITLVALEQRQDVCLPGRHRVRRRQREAALLVGEIVRPNRDASTLPVRRSSEAAYLAAIEFEARHRPDPTGKEPSAAKRYAVAKYVLGLLRNKNASQKTAEGIVRGWRELRHYRENVALQRPATLRVKT